MPITIPGLDLDSGCGYLEAVSSGLDRKVHILAVIPNHGIIVLAQTETEAVGKEPTYIEITFEL